jgi:hexosaminidase
MGEWRGYCFLVRGETLWSRWRGSARQCLWTKPAAPALAAAGALALAGLAGCPPPHPQTRTSGLPSTEPLATAAASSLPLVPRPRSMSTCPGAFRIEAETEVHFDHAAGPAAERLARWLGVARLRPLEAAAPDPPRGIVLRAETSHDARHAPPGAPGDEAHRIEVDAKRALVRARTSAGAFYGAQTLAQLASARPLRGGGRSAPRPIPCVRIDDAPRSSFRAMHLDVARHFFSREVVERYVDLLSYYRFNVFHWHLTDDQGFRLPVRGRPALTSVGAPGGAYTREDVESVVRTAHERFVTVVPEIDMPGHTRAVLAAYPELSCTGERLPVPTTWGIFDDVLCAGNEETYALVSDVLSEVTELFPSRLVHVGGDEVPKTRWNACPKCRAVMARENLDAEGLQGRFLERIAKVLRERGRRVMAWDEALEGGLPGDGVVVAWQDQARGALAAQRGHDVVMAPHDVVYFNIHQSRAGTEPGHEGFIPWQNVLAFDPVPRSLASPAALRVLGGEGTVWTEYIRTPEEIDLMAMPRMAALSEALWSGAATDPAPFVSRFGAQREALDRANVRYFVEPPVGLRDRKLFLERAEVKLAPPALFPDGVVRMTTDGSEPGPSSPIAPPSLPVTETTRLAARLFLPGGRESPIARGTIERATLAAPVPLAQASPGVRFTYVEGEFRQVPDFAKLRPARTGTMNVVTLSPSFRSSLFAVLFEGFVRAPESGIYRIVARADDGVLVDVAGERVVADDGEHAPRDKDGEVALAAGFHPIRVAYFQGLEGKELTIACEGPGLPLGPCPLFVAGR